MYIDAYLNKDKEEVVVAERINGERIENRLPAKYVIYYEDPRGNYTSMFGDKCSKLEFNNKGQHSKELKKLQDRKLFETDINPVNRALEEYYLGCELPDLHVGFFDIEVDFDPNRGFARPEDPHSKVTAITTHLSWCDRLVTFAIPPQTLSYEQGKDIGDKFDDTFIFETEEELLEAWLDVIDDVDVLSGWNSTGFDIPYMVRRIEQVLGREYTRRMCLWNLLPKKRIYTKFNKEHITYDLTGRVHLDYMDIFKNNSGQQYHSYKLDFIGEMVVGEKKTEYEGTLDELYNKDFEKFIEYNRQDVDLLVKMELKLKYIPLVNQLAHQNTIPIPATMGKVQMIEQGIINEAHAHNLIVPDKSHPGAGDEHVPVPGAYVADPERGLHHWIGSIDINSLYPSIIRALNMGPETIVGQLRPTYTNPYVKEREQKFKSATLAWHDMFATLEYDMVMNKDTKHTISFDLEDGQTVELTGKELYEYIFESGADLCITANGTVFRTDIEGIIPGLLEKWYNERVEMKGAKSDASKIQSGLEINDSLARKLEA